MKNLLAAIMISLTLFSCQKDDLSEFNQVNTCDCFSPLGVEAEWQYETTRNHYDNNGNIKVDKVQNWNVNVVNIVDEMVALADDGILYHVRKQGNNSDNLYAKKYIREVDNEYQTPYKTILKDEAVGTEWQIDLHRRRVIQDRMDNHSVAGKNYKNVIVVEELKTYNNGEEYIMSTEYYAKNVGLIYSKTYNYDNGLVSTDTKKLRQYYSELEI